MGGKVASRKRKGKNGLQTWKKPREKHTEVKIKITKCMQKLGNKMKQYRAQTDGKVQAEKPSDWGDPGLIPQSTMKLTGGDLGPITFCQLNLLDSVDVRIKWRRREICVQS